MKKYLVLFCLSVVLISGCSKSNSEVESEPIATSIEEYEKAIPASSFSKGEDNRYTSIVNPEIMYFADSNSEGEIIEVYAGAMTKNFESQKEQIKRSFHLLVQSVDPTLSDIQIEKLFADLRMTWDINMFDTSHVKRFNDVTYAYYGDNEQGSILLRINK